MLAGVTTCVIIEIDTLARFVFAIEAARLQHGLQLCTVSIAISNFLFSRCSFFAASLLIRCCFVSNILASDRHVALSLNTLFNHIAVCSVVRKLQAFFRGRAGRAVFE